MILDLDPYLRPFLTVTEISTGNGAATSLNRTQATVSMQSRKLEGRVGKGTLRSLIPDLDLAPDGPLLIPYAREI